MVEVSLGREFILVVVGLEPFGHGFQLFDREKEELGIFEYGHRQRSAAGEATDMGLHIAVRLGPRLDHGFLGECGSRYGLSLGALMRAFRALVLAGRSEAIRRPVELGLKAKEK